MSVVALTEMQPMEIGVATTVTATTFPTKEVALGALIGGLVGYLVLKGEKTIIGIVAGAAIGYLMGRK